MTASSCVALALVASALLAPPVAASAPPAPASADAAADEHTLLVRFGPGGAEGGLRHLRSLGGGEASAVPGTGFWVVDTGERTAADVESEWRNLAEVQVIEPNYVRQAAAVPNDPQYPRQASYLDAIRLPQAWDLSTGSDELTLAIVDSGVDLDHPDLAGRLLPGRDFVDGDDSPEDEYGHGTQVATIAAASGNDGTGMAGVAWRGKILPVKVIGAKGGGRDSDIAAGITWAADHGAHVINLSLYGRSSGQTVKAAIEYAQSLDALVVAAAGNDSSSSPLYPAAYDGVVAVAAVDGGSELASFSNYGSWIDLAAPGVAILAGSKDGTYDFVEGTSFAAPIVSGVVLLTRARFPQADASEIAQRMRAGARDVGVLGGDDVFGYGIVDALGALGGPRSEYRLDPATRVHEPDSTLDRASRIAQSRPITAMLAPADDVDWFYTDVASPAFVTFEITPPSGQTHPMSHEVTVYGPALHSIDGMTVVESAGTTTVRVPAGRYYLRVRGDSPFASTGTYQLTTSSTPAPVGYFATDSVAGAFVDSEASAVTMGDLTGDGLPDLMATVGGEVVLVPQEAGRFESFERHRTEGAATGVAVGDLDADGDLDAVAATSAGAEVFRQTDGRLSGPELFSTEGAEQVELGDLDGDGRGDVVLALAGGGIGVVRNGKDLQVVTAVPVAEIEVADMDGDGLDDIAALECVAACQDVAVYTDPLGPSSAREVVHVPALNGVPGAGCSLGVGDVTGDGRHDAFASCPEAGGVFVLPQEQDGTFGSPTPYLSGVNARALEGEDLNGDGRDDLIMSYSYHEEDEGEEEVYGRTRVLWQQPDGSLGFERDLSDDSDSFPAPKGMALGDVDGDGLLDVANGQRGWLLVDRLTPGDPCLKDQEERPDGLGQQLWVGEKIPSPSSLGVPPDVAPTIRFVRTIDADSLGRASAKLTDASTGTSLPHNLHYDPTTNSVALQPRGSLTSGHAYLVRVAGLRDTSGATMPPESFRFAVASEPTGSLPPSPDSAAPPPMDDLPHQVAQNPPPTRSGYWMVGSDGKVYPFGDARLLGEPVGQLGSAEAVDLEPSGTGNGYWVLDETGRVYPYGDALDLGGAALGAGEKATSLSSAGKGYWVFTNKGQVLPFGDANHYGDMAGTRLNGPVLDSVATPTGKGYYMVGSDGGVFSFGDAKFVASTGNMRINKPVMSMAPDPDGAGYWLVASDGGIFAFEAPFLGSMGSVRLNKPVTGMVPGDAGYLMVAEDGGIFSFGDVKFHGSLGANPPPTPVVAVALMP